MNYDKKSTIKKQEQINSYKEKNKMKRFVRLGRYCLFFVIILCIIAMISGAFIIHDVIQDAPSLTQNALTPSKQKSIVYDMDGEVIKELSNYQSNRVIIPSEQMPTNLKNAFVAIEDSRFYQHNGIDLKGIARAIFSNIKSFSLKEGASTITQQLIKNNIFDAGGENNSMDKIKRKIQEQYLALKIEKQYTKDEILTNYLNTINLGQGVLGVQAASKLYFNKDTSDLTLSECAVLASITQNPSNLEPLEHPEKNKARRTIVLNNMLKQNLISEEQYKTAMADDVYKRIKLVNTKKASKGADSYFVDALIKNLVNKLREEKNYTLAEAYQLIYGGGLKIYSTQDTEIQSLCTDIMNDPDYYPKDTHVSLTYRLTITREDGSEENYSEYDVQSYFRKLKDDPDYDIIYKNKKSARKACDQFKESLEKEGDQSAVERFSVMLQPQASFTLIEQKTGEVRALIGGSDRAREDSSIFLNRAIETPRQPGSTFKILAAYLPGLDNQTITLASVFDDAPYKYVDSGKKVKNWDGQYQGLTTVRNAIKDSINVVAAKAIMKSTPQTGYDYLLSLGFTTLVEKETDEKTGKIISDIIQPLALGGITEGVTNLELTGAYAAIANNGQYIEPTLFTKVLDADGNVILQSEQKKKKVMQSSTAWLLTDVMKGVVTDGTGTAVSLSSDMPVAGKTGTTSNNVDSWFTGYTPYYTASIWMGYDINKKFASQNYHKKIWKTIMDKIISVKKLETKDFDDCDDITSAYICSKSGKLAINGVCDHEINPGSYSGIKNEIRKEYFAKGTKPTEYCDVHVKVTLCSSSNLLAKKSCPKDKLYTRVYLVELEEDQLDTLDANKLLPSRLESQYCTKDHSIPKKIISEFSKNKKKNSSTNTSDKASGESTDEPDKSSGENTDDSDKTSDEKVEDSDEDSKAEENEE